VWHHHFSRIHSLFDYTDETKILLHEIKYNGKRRVARFLGRESAGTIPADFLADMDLLLPVPLHPLKQFKRGYNQASLIAEGISSGLYPSIPVVTGLLRRNRYTRTQTKLDRGKRADNVHSAFTATANASATLAGKGVIVVDDVITTGATTDACAKILLAHGCREVRVLSLVRD
jgi:ComF family protein